MLDRLSTKLRQTTVGDAVLTLVANLLDRLDSSDKFRPGQFLVPVEKCIDAYGASYRADRDNRHIVATLKEYQANPKLTYEESSFCRFARNFRPQNLQEALFGETFDDTCATARLKFPAGFSGFGPSPPMPWSTEAEIERYRRGAPGRSGGAGQSHFTRTIETYESIRTKGYDPYADPEGSVRNRYIQVVMLRKGNDERFVVVAGKHRAGALSVLGWREIPVILDTRRPCVVDIANAENWNVVRAKLYDLKAAHRVFDRLFDDSVGSASWQK